MDELIYRDAVELAGLIQNGAVSSEEVMHMYLERIQRVNPKVNALINLLPAEQALELAREADAQLRHGNSAGPFHGLPHAVKDLTDLEGWPTTAGWAAGAQIPALSNLGFGAAKTADSLVVSRMRQAGLLFIGKTNVPEFGLGSHTVNHLFGPTRNPYDTAKTAGGSSGGAAAALASGMLPLADGSDLGGSLRNPAAFCNVVGFRPSIGRIPEPGAGFEARLATAGPMGRSVRDVAALFSVQAGPDRRDPISLREHLVIEEEDLKSSPGSCRIGWTADFGALPAEPEIVQTCYRALSVFRNLNLEVAEEVYPDILTANPDKDEMDAMQVFRVYRVLALSEFRNQIIRAIGETGIRQYMRRATSQYQFINAFEEVGIEDYYRARINRARIYESFLQFFERCDFLVLPTTQIRPFDLQWEYPEVINDQHFSDYLEWMAICCVISLTGLPAISIPCGLTGGGLPVGLQIVGKPGADLEVLQLAYAFEKASGHGVKHHPPKNIP